MIQIHEISFNNINNIVTWQQNPTVEWAMELAEKKAGTPTP